ncbi:TetR/AcrR family transcriptional regulator [Nocardioides sp.]|jgi:AcrR family transcriptional regulator|uniref:TetR/AcrR family transcriptional regulator n=1 Tax=Nocardioides sp. TaxID=35761 RepID=UPI002BF695C8|nr:TetR/AcrR family transcriptional regulator [Nocardioides sp.]HVX55816.1 TetR/AcrR family transcriptional regulator [Nocardioides sp.]
MPAAETSPSARERELVEAAYAYVLEHGIGDLSLRPLASAIGSSPRVLLFLFDSKEGLVRRLLARAREDELGWLAAAGPRAELTSPDHAVRVIWGWLSAAEHAPLLRLWVEAYGRSLVDPSGPWAGFAEATVTDWLRLLESTGADAAARTLALAGLRGLLLDLLATGDLARIGAALEMLAVRLSGTVEP